MNEDLRSLKKDRVIFKDELDESQIRMEDDVDSVQHLDLSVIDDHNDPGQQS